MIRPLGHIILSGRCQIVHFAAGGTSQGQIHGAGRISKSSILTDKSGAVQHRIRTTVTVVMSGKYQINLELVHQGSQKNPCIGRGTVGVERTGSIDVVVESHDTPFGIGVGCYRFFQQFAVAGLITVVTV